MADRDTPGIRFEALDNSGGGIATLRTDVAGFVGIAQKGPLNLAVPVDSQRQFEAWFGTTIDAGYLAYSARAFFENGGRRMWVVRVASTAASGACATVFDAAGPAWRIEASSPGVWGNQIGVQLTETRRVQRRGQIDPLRLDSLFVDNVAGFDRHTLIELSDGPTRERAVVRLADPVSGRLTLERPLALVQPYRSLRVETVTYAANITLAGRLVAQQQDLSAIPRHPRYGPAVLCQPWIVIDPESPDVWTGPGTEADTAVDYFRRNAGRGALVPPQIVIRELRGATRRNSLELFTGLTTATAGPLTPISGGAPVQLTGGADGLAALSLFDFTGAQSPPDASDTVILANRRGLQALDLVDEVALLAVPDIHIHARPANPVTPPPPCVPDPCLPGAAPQPAIPIPVGDLPPLFPLDAIALVQQAAIDQCERRRDRVAILDAPFEACNRATFAASDLREWCSRFDTAFAGLFAPWIKVSDPLRGGAGAGLTRSIPPSGHVAGHGAAIDLRSGVHVAFANVPLLWAQGLSLEIGDGLHGLLNSIGVNALRTVPGRGIRVLGARTMSSDPDWRYLNVRRLVSMVAEAIGQSIQWAVFEPNDWHTRAKLRLVIESFLLTLWSRGALAGAAPEAGFRVRCDDTNNPPARRDLGQLLIEVDLAPTIPFEFITLRIGREASGFAVAGDPSAMAA